MDITFKFHRDHICWAYQPRSNKPLLPYHSAHTKLVKGGVVNLGFRSTLQKSCPHLMGASSSEQSEQLLNAGYPSNIQVSVAEALLKKLKTPIQATPQDQSARPQKLAVVPYTRGVSQDLRKVRARGNVTIVFSALNKLSYLSKLCVSKAAQDCSKKPKRIPLLHV